MRACIIALFALLCAGCAGSGGGSVPANPPAGSPLSGFKAPAEIFATAPPAPFAPSAMTPPKPSQVRRTSSTATHPAFFAGEAALSNGIYYLAMPNGNVFGYYSYMTDGITIFHQDMGYESMIDANDGVGGIYFYDFTSQDWWYTSRSQFPYVYDYTRRAWLYYFADTQKPGHYTTNPRYFNNMLNQTIITLPGAVVWQTGGGSALGPGAPVSGSGQCTTDNPSISGSNASFAVTRNTNKTYMYGPNTFSGASTCYRNQLNPYDPQTGTNYLLRIGSHYSFTFQTVVTFNGNYAYQGAPDGGLAADIPAIVWQTHTLDDGSQTAQPCDILTIQNTYKKSTDGYHGYDPVSAPGSPTWNFKTCDDSDSATTAYNSPSPFLYDGEPDSWQIDITAQVQPTSPGSDNGGSVVVRRNGVIVYNLHNHVCDATRPQCWWNFGAYMEMWENTEEPPGWNSAGVTIQVNNMTLRRDEVH
jgi:hypothetical protein